MTSFAHQAAQIDLVALARYLEARLPGFRGPIEAQKTPTGQSNPTFLLSQPQRPLRAAQEAAGPAAEKRACRRSRVSRHAGPAGRRDVPVPRMLHLCEDESVLGTMFFVMEFVDGTIFWDPALPELTNAQRAKVYDEENRALAALHSVDPAKVGLADFGKAGSYFARQRDRWTKQYRASETERVEDMETLIAWLEKQRAARRRPRLAGARRLSHRQHDLRQGCLAAAGGDRLGAVDARAIRSRTWPTSACSGACRTAT